MRYRFDRLWGCRELKIRVARDGAEQMKASEQQRWKERLIAMLKERGVTFPAAVRRVVPPPAEVVEEERWRKAQRLLATSGRSAADVAGLLLTRTSSRSYA